MSDNDEEMKVFAAAQEEKGRSSDPSALPLFYANPIPVSFDRHAKKKLLPRGNTAFAASANAIPINLAEFGHVSRHYPIAFVAAEDPFPVAVVGLRSGENLFIDNEGHWQKNCYIPAYVRRYPFILMSGGQGDNLSLGIDETPDTFSDEEGIALYEDNGSPSEQTKTALGFCQSYNSAIKPTQDFMTALKEQELLVERQANIVKAEGQALSLTGFHTVDPDKLGQLESETIASWWKNGWLQAITAHQISSLNWGDLADRS